MHNIYKNLRKICIGKGKVMQQNQVGLMSGKTNVLKFLKIVS
jgi:hypothetical protein